jgi:predicted transcriptional regulator
MSAVATSTDSRPPSAVFQLRADPKLLQEVKALASKRHVSANRFLVEAVEAAIAREKEQEWREGFEAMSRDPDVNNVEYAIPAAQEVMFGN